VARLQATGATLIGGILTKFERKSAAFSYAHASYGYDYQYGGHSQKRALIAPATHDIKEAAE
jgi:hypothetical protein